MSKRNLVLLVLVVLFAVMSAGCLPQSEEIENAADSVRADGRVDAAAEIVSDGDALVAVNNAIFSGDECKAQLKAAWQHVGDGKVKYLETIRPNCVGTDEMDTWNEKFEEAAECMQRSA